MNHQQMTAERIRLKRPLSVMPLYRMPYAKASVVQYPNKTVLVSYATEVAEIRWRGADGAWLRVNGLYSATTRRHISAFMHEFGMGNDYKVARKCAEMGHWYNLETGEIVARFEL